MIGTWQKNTYGDDCLVNGNTAYLVEAFKDSGRDEWQVWFFTYSPNGGVSTEQWIGTTFSRDAAMRLAEVISDLEAPK